MPDDTLELLAAEIGRQAADLLAQGLIWLPGMAPLLAKHEWAALERQSGLLPPSYGTDRVREGDPEGALNVFAEIRTPEAIELSMPAMIVEHPFRSESYYRTLDISFYGARELDAFLVIRKIRSAFDCLSLAQDLIASILHLVRVIHIVRPPDPAYDVSHSDPQVPFSVFVSLPEDETERGRLRLAEEILHEAMHLQLTLLEGHTPLVKRPEAARYSPWKRMARPIQGVMHGLYVFGVIDAFLEVVEGSCDSQTIHYVRDRRAQIAEEVTEATSPVFREDLTDVGTLLLNAIVARFTNANR
ncbi:aKG-HExxH-type peptide beta-hydroxylase [Bradyrhizobium ganzhouense]|uniref:aKG-HExxH-type peptide beta-hydroxylase n=1 Tax=Bradyrhizobium ganzhouense TaxID=1179767 RepID=UPI003CEE6167